MSIPIPALGVAILALTLTPSVAHAERLLAIPGADPTVPDYRYDAEVGVVGSPANVTGWNSDTANTLSGANDRTWSGFTGVTHTTVTGHPSFTQALTFSGADSGQTTTFGSTFDTSASFEFWFRPASIGTDMVIWESGGGTHGAAMQLNADGTLTFLTRDNTNNQTNVSTLSANPIDIANFHQVVGVVDPTAGETRIYLDGQLNSSATSTRTWELGTDDSGLGGGSTLATGQGAGIDGTLTFSGDIALVRFFDTALDDMQVHDLFLQVSPPPLTPEPGSIALLGTALAGLAYFAWRRRSS